MSNMKNSAYRSMQLAREGKTKNMDNGLRIWIAEKWKNLSPISLNDNAFYECGKKSKEQIIKKIPSICRPSVRINEDTPVLAKNYTKSQIQKAIDIKKKGERIEWKKL